jgi:hypothetical protein
LEQRSIIMNNETFLRSKSVRLILPLFVYVLFTFAFVLICINNFPPIFSVEGYKTNFHWPLDEQITIANFFKTWDAQFYLYLSSEGYKAGNPASGYYPLLPFLIRIFSYLTGGNHLIAGLIVVNIFFISAMVLFHYFVLSNHGEKVADLSLIFLLAFPGSLFFSFIYTESLFLFFSILFFIFLFRGEYLKAGIASFFLPLTRSVGIVAILPLLLHIILNRGRSKSLFYSLFPVAGFGFYFFLMYLFTGNPLEGNEALKDYHFTHPTFSRLVDLIFFAKLLVYPFIYGTVRLHGFANSGIDRLWIFWFMISLIFLWRKNKYYFAYSMPMGFIPAIMVMTVSFTRHVTLVFPIFILLAEFFADEERKLWRWMIVTIFFSIKIFFLIWFINHYWVG